ncbi:MAG TPA: ABC transporter permease [Vicinamibacterales bacterium]|nr:ABC transporter permease [Vicinamibacterales bacterium]
MASFLQDLKFGTRLLFRHRGFTVVAALVLAFGIGANTAVFTIINSLVLKPRMGATDAELAGVYSRDRTQADAYRAFSYPNYSDLRDQKVAQSLTAHTFALVGLTEGTVTKRVFGDVIVSNYFETFGVQLLKGRPFTLEEERPGADLPVAILSYGMYQRLGGTDAVLNSTVKINGRQFEVVGVAPRGFGGSMTIVSPELYVPTGVYNSLSNDFLREGLPATLADRRHHALILIARLAPGATIASAKPALEHAGAQLEQAFPGENQNQDLMMAPLSRMSVSTSPSTDDQIGTLSIMLFSMSGLVLLVASFNLANMLLARGSARQKEFAIRLAIGGSRLRIVRQLLAESLVLAVAGGVVATLVAWWATRTLMTQVGPRAPVSMLFDTTPDIRILIATMGLSLVSAVLFGLGPAWRHAKTDAVPELKDQAGEMAGRRRSRFATRNVLVMGQLALSLVTLTAAGMFLRSAVESAVTDPGFTFERGIMVNVDPSLAGRDQPATRRFYEQALARLRAMPGVASASVGSLMPFGEFTETNEIQKAGAPLRGEALGTTSMGANVGEGDDKVVGLVDSIATSIGADYFKTIGLDVKRGREFTTSEEIAPDGARVAIIDETLATKLFGRDNPLDQIVQWQSGRRGASKTMTARVVGVVAPTRHQLLEDGMRPHIYTPAAQNFRAAMFLHARTNASSADAEAAMLPDVRRLLLSIDSDLPIIALETRPMYRDRNMILWILRAGAQVFLAFGLIALFMTVVGVYGVKSYVVARRTREIGIRVALGATRRDVVNMVVRDGLLTTGIGLITGLALSVLTGLALRAMLVGDGKFDVTVVAGAGLTLAVAATIAAWLPARRATKVPPTLALRSE